MADEQFTEITPSKVFISYAWENQPIAKQLQRDLQRDGVEVFVDYENIAGGDLLPKHINAALNWCNTLVLLWSAEAANSYYVEQEWTSAFNLQRKIIPCLLDATALPALLCNRLFLQFSKCASSYPQLCQALGVRLVPHFSLRHAPLDSLSTEAVKAMLKQHDFYCARFAWNKDFNNPQGKGIVNEFYQQQNGMVILDRATGLSWQRSGSPDAMRFMDAEKYIDALNGKEFAGYKNWRLPTLEEAMSLMEPKAYSILHISSLFDQMKSWIWTADKPDIGMVWVVDFGSAFCYFYRIGGNLYVRAVRSG